MSLRDCDFDGHCIGYAERIEVSDKDCVCEESGILIPPGQPYAHCKLAYCDDGCGHEEHWCQEEDADPDGENPHWESFTQAIEVWRFLRRQKLVHGLCAGFGNAVEAYWDEYTGTAEDADKFRYLALSGAIKRARERYEKGRGPKLHLSEQESLISGKWSPALPLTQRVPETPNG